MAKFKFTSIFLSASLISIAYTQSNVDHSINFEDVFDHECKADGMSATIKLNDLSKLGSWKDNYSKLTLNSDACKGTLRNSTNTVVFNAGSWDGDHTECDTRLVSNGGIKTFWNMVQYTPDSNSQITRDAEGLYNFSCTYNMTATEKFELSLAHKIITNPIDTITFAGQEGRGDFSATMELFRNENFNDSFVGSGEVSISLEQFLYIMVTLNATDKDIALTLVDCWATPGPNAGHQIKHTLLEDGCSRDPTVEIMHSGIDQTAKWKSQMFEFVKHDSVWLHCDVQACHKKKEDCSSVCEEEDDGALFSLNNKKRKKREIVRVSMNSNTLNRNKRASDVVEAIQRNSVYDPNILTVGPVNSKERKSAKKKAQVGPVIGITVCGIIVAIGMIYGIYKVLALKQSEESKIIEANNNNQVGADWNLYGSNQAEDKTKQNPLNVY